MHLNGDGQLLAGHRAGDLRLAASRDYAGFGGVERSRDFQRSVHRQFSLYNQLAAYNQSSICRNQQFLLRFHRHGSAPVDLAIRGQGIGITDYLSISIEQHTGFHAIIFYLRFTDNPTISTIIRS